MSTAEVEQPSQIAQSSSQRLATDGIELTGFRPAPRRTSLAAIINVDDGNSGPGRYTRAIRRGQLSMPMSMDGGSAAPAPEANPVIVVEDNGAGETQGNRTGSNGAQNQPIVVLDSDEEQAQPSDPAEPSFRRRHVGVRRRGGGSSSSSFRIFSPPPPPPQRHPVPQVPFLPPIIAEPVPFAILPPPVNNHRNYLPFDQPAQPINNPNARAINNNGNGIQLGGGLLSQGNGAAGRHGPRAQVRFHPHAENFGELFEGSDGQPLQRASRIFGRFWASYFSGNTFLSRPFNQNSSNSRRGRSSGNARDIPRHQMDHIPQDVNDFGGGGGARDALPAGAGFFGLTAAGGLGPWGRRDLALGLGPDYDRRMTHPERAGPGWTYDFGTDQEEGRSKLDGSEILVCAKCLDPLLANADGMVDVSEEERKGRRVWGLRCGHVLDGKCVGTLMMPEVERDLSKMDIDPEHDHKGKEKEIVIGEKRSVGPEDAGENEAHGLVTNLDVKGKGKASAAPIRAPTPPPLDHKEKSITISTELEDNLLPEATSIRSRLRSRRNFVVPFSATTSSSPRHSARHVAATDSRGGSASTRRRKSKRKRATKVATEVIEERYEWMCPVSGCGCMHVSVKVGGSWKMDADDGAVAIFV